VKNVDFHMILPIKKMIIKNTCNYLNNALLWCLFFSSICQQSFSISQFMWQSVILMQVCILLFFTYLLYGSNFIP
jgi:hypothetical protein